VAYLEFKVPLKPKPFPEVIYNSATEMWLLSADSPHHSRDTT